MFNESSLRTILVLLLTLFPLLSGAYAMDPAELRKARTEQILSSKKVPLNKQLPLVEDASETTLRSAQDVARRAIALYHVSALANGADRKTVVNVLKGSGVWGSLAPSEITFIESSNPTRQQIVNAAWRVEALWTLLWALGKVEVLEFPTRTCDVGKLHSMVPKSDDVVTFINSAKLRGIEEVLDATDMIYRTHWAVRDAQLNGKLIPASLNPGVVVERHYALNWLTGYADEWDEITTDT